MSLILVQGSSSAMFDTCANCQIPFQRECSKVKQIMVRDFSSAKEEQEEVISIYEALSVIFEIPPLTRNERSEDENEEVSTKKEIFKNKSVFEIFKSSSNKGDYAVCLKCSEKLKDLYRCFQSFTSVCKLESHIGQILQSLQKESSSKSASRGVEGSEGASSRSNFTISVRVKTEPPESEQESGNENEEDDRDDDDNNDDHGDHIDDQTGASTSSPVGLPLISTESADEQGHIKQSPPESDHDNNTDLNFDVSENEDNNEEQAVPKNSIKLAGGRGIITQLKCPKCNKHFLHKNTLICHRRIIHRENIKLLPPPPFPAVELSRQGNIERLKALADANGKTSACPICRAEVPRTEIRHHLSIHTRSLNKPWLCTICGRNFDSQTDLQKHAKVHICGIPCKRCGKKVPTLNMLSHIRQCMMLKSGSGKTVLDFPCKVCCKLFQTREKLLEHRSRVHAHFWRCKLCGIKFVERKKMHNHMNTHRQKKSRKCKICDKSFDRIDVLRLHIKRFHRNNEGPATPAEHDDDPSSPSTTPSLQPYKMNTVRRGPYKKRKNRPTIKVEVSTSTATVDSADVDVSTTPILEDRFICKGCNDAFPRATDLDTHLLQVHADQESFLCKICNRKLQDSYCLKLHVKTHGEMKPMECCHPNCGKVYRDRNTFFYHLKEKHSMDTKSIVAKYPNVFRQRNRDYSTRRFSKRIGQTPKEKGEYPCEVCGRVFTQIYGLRSHVKLVHDKVKDFLCKYCGKAFARKSYFLLHERLHTTNESPYKCHLCNKGFRLPGNLRVHLKSTIHNPNRDFVCDICGKGFNRNDNLRLHVRTVHLKIPVKKPKSEASDRYTHGGRNRIYMEVRDEDDDYKPNASSTAGGSSLMITSVPLPGTSQSFFNLQNELYQQFSSNHLVESHNKVDAASMDSSSQFSGDDGSCVDFQRTKPPPVSLPNHQNTSHLSNLSIPILQLQQQQHPQQHARSNSDGTGNSNNSSGGHHSFPSDYHFRGFQYK